MSETQNLLVGALSETLSATLLPYVEKTNKLEKLVVIQGRQIKEQKVSIKNLNEQLSSYKMKIDSLEKELELIKQSIILSLDNQNKGGRPSLTDEEIEYIKELYSDGISMRKISEMLEVSLGTVHKYSKRTKKEK